MRRFIRLLKYKHLICFYRAAEKPFYTCRDPDFLQIDEIFEKTMHFSSSCVIMSEAKNAARRLRPAADGTP
jgi:hypothetical protein